MTITPTRTEPKDELRSRMVHDVFAWAETTESAGALAGRLIAETEPYRITDHATADLLPPGAAVFDADGVLLQRPEEPDAWWQPGYSEAVGTEAITLPAVVVHPWGWRP